MSMHHLRTAASLSFLLAAAPSLRADPITLDTNHNSTIVASVLTTTPPTQSDTNDVTALPYTTPDTESASGESTTVTPALSTASLAATFALNAANLNTSATGTVSVYFVAGPNVSYTLAGTGTSNDPVDYVSVDFDDQTTNTTLFNEGVSSGTPLTINSFGGPLTGSLTAGDSYFIYVQAGITNGTIAAPTLAPAAAVVDDTLAGTYTLAFTQVPEPTTLALIPLLCAAATRRRHRRA